MAALDVYDVIVVGAGLSGAVCAERFANVLGKRVLVIDKRHHIGGNCYDYIDDETGLLISKYGPHLFHANEDHVWEYVQRFCEWDRYDHKAVANVNGKIVTLPVNINTVNTLFNETMRDGDDMKRFMESRVVKYDKIVNGEESCLARFGQEIYESIFKPYTTKQWDREPRDLDASVLNRIPLRYDFDDRYFSDRYQALPRGGYTRFFENLLKNPLIRVKLGTDYFSPGFYGSAPITIFTGPIDQYFSDSGLEKLQYRSLHFELERHHQTGFVQTHAVVNYPGADVPWTRVTEYKHMFGNASRAPDHSVTVKEYPSEHGPEYYPVVNQKNMELYEKYRELATEAEDDSVYFLGRLASFKYLNMNDAIRNSLAFFDEKFGKPAEDVIIPQSAP
jgi:UDP-galactopyranose mutase